jgi:ABC-2 type transport system ATP-binding protein
MQERTPVIELNNLTVSYGRQKVLDGLTCALSGKSIGLLGPNGAGKTTLLMTLLGFTHPREGWGKIRGRDITRAGTSIRQGIGYMPENESLIPGMTAVRMVRFLAEIHGLPGGDAMERAHEALFYVGLGEARYRKVETFSTGMKQRLKLAQAIVHAPKLLLLDEPTNGLDPRERIRILQLIREIREQNDLYVVISSHLLGDVEEACEEVLILKKGSIAAICNLAEERRSNRRLFEIEIRGDQDRFSAALEKVGCEYALSPRRRLKVVVPEGMDVRRLYEIAAERDVQIRRLFSKRDSLEEIFLKAMGESNGGL